MMLAGRRLLKSSRGRVSRPCRGPVARNVRTPGQRAVNVTDVQLSDQLVGKRNVLAALLRGAHLGRRP